MQDLPELQQESQRILMQSDITIEQQNQPKEDFNKQKKKINSDIRTCLI